MSFAFSALLALCEGTGGLRSQRTSYMVRFPFDDVIMSCHFLNDKSHFLSGLFGIIVLWGIRTIKYKPRWTCPIISLSFCNQYPTNYVALNAGESPHHYIWYIKNHAIVKSVGNTPYASPYKTNIACDVRHGYTVSLTNADRRLE